MDKLKGKLHIGFPRGSGPEYVMIQVQDGTSHCQAVEIRVSYEDFTRALSSMSVDCDYDFNMSGVIGKKSEYKTVPVVFKEEVPYDKDELRAMVLPRVTVLEVDGWKVDWYTILESRHKFYRQMDKGITTIDVGMRRYV